MWKKGENGIEGRNKRESAAYDSESNPAISCIPSQSCSHTFHIWWWYLHGGKAWAYGSGAVLKFLCSNFWEKVWFCFQIWREKRNPLSFLPINIFLGEVVVTILYIIYICIYIDLAMCELLLCIAVLRGKSPVAWWWCRYGHYRLHIMPDVPCVCVCMSYSITTDYGNSSKISCKLSQSDFIP